MTDIVTRLRARPKANAPKYAQQMFEAADEIESLRNKLKAANNGIANDCYKAVAGAADLLVEENEKLRNALVGCERVGELLAYGGHRDAADNIFRIVSSVLDKE